MRSRLLFVIFVAIGALTVASCGRTGENGQGTAPRQGTVDINPQPANKVKDGGTFTLPITAAIQQYNNAQVQGTSADLGEVLSPLLPTPFISQADGTVTVNKNYVESAQLVSSEPQVVEYTINPKARWTDGTPITWRDFAATIHAQSGKDPAYEPASVTGFQNVSSVERGANDRQVRVTFGTKYAEWEGMLGYILPASAIDTPEKFNTGWVGRIPLTAGPFRVKAIDNTAKTITLERDPGWWGDRPKLDTIIFSVIAPDSAAQAFQSGAIDAIDIGPDVASYLAVSQMTTAVVRKSLAPNWRVINVGYRPGPMRDPNVRLAIFKGIDRSIIAKAAIGPIVPNVTPLENHIYVQGQRGYQDNGAAYNYDKNQAAALLDQAGWRMNDSTKVREKNGVPLALQWIVPAGVKTSSDEAQVAQNQLGEIGIKINIQSVDTDAWQNQYLTVGNFDLLNMSWIGSTFPISSTSSIYTYDPNNVRQNYGRVPDAQGIGQLYARATAELDDQKRVQLGNEIDQAIWRETFSIPLYQRPDAVGVPKNVANFGAFGFAQPDWTKVGFTA